jgi:hypothetical protein
MARKVDRMDEISVRSDFSLATQIQYKYGSGLQDCITKTDLFYLQGNTFSYMRSSLC